VAGGPEDKDRDPLAGDPGGAEGEGGARAFVSDAVRKAVLTGLGAVFLTEEGARKFAREWKLPRDVAGYVASQAGGAKDEIVRVVTEEIRRFFESPALRREVVRMISSMSIEVHAEVRLKPSRGGKVSPEVKVKGVKPRLRRRDEEPPDADEPPPGAEEPDPG
jgi:hypothetical protein